MRRARVGLLGVLLGCGDADVAADPSATDTSSGATSSASVTTDIDATDASSHGAGTSPAPTECENNDTRPCYHGPEGSEDAGACHAGLETCDFWGRWGPCVGEVVPEPQDCATPQDESCTEPTVCAGARTWVRAFPVDDGGISPATLFLAPDGDIVAAGTYQGTLTLGGQAHTAVSKADIWVARFDPQGEARWFRRFGPSVDLGDIASGRLSPGNIRFDPSGDILVTATCAGTVDFGDGPLPGESDDAVVLRFAAAGELKWARRFVGLRGPLLAAPAGDGGVWLAGTLEGASVDFGGGPLKSLGWGDVVLARLDIDGNHLWSRRHGDPGHQDVRAIDGTPDGGLVWVGGLEGALDLGGEVLVSVGTRDAYVARLDAAGDLAWARRYGDVYAQSADGVRVDGEGTVALSGAFESTIDLGGGALTTPKIESDPSPGHLWWPGVFVAQLGADGSHQWSSAFVSQRADVELVSFERHPFDRGLDGTLALAGGAAAPLQFPADVWGRDGGPWIAALRGDGAPRWLHSVYPEFLHAPAARAAVGASGAVIAVFDIYGVQDLDGLALGEEGRSALVLAEYGP